MKTFLLYTISLFFGLNFFGQNDFEKATFKNGDVKKIISEKFYALNGNKSTGEEIVGEKEDLMTFNKLKREILTSLTLGVFSKERRTLMYQTRTVRN